MLSWSWTLIKAKGQILKGNAKGSFTRLKLMVDLLKGSNARCLIANVDSWLAGWIAAKAEMQRLKCMGLIAKVKTKLINAKYKGWNAKLICKCWIERLNKEGLIAMVEC